MKLAVFHDGTWTKKEAHCGTGTLIFLIVEFLLPLAVYLD